MRFKILLMTIILLGVSVFGGCTGVTPQQKTASTLPEPAIAKEEAKNALREWQVLLETGQNAEFIRASMPTEIYELALTENGELKPEVVKKLRAFAPKVVNALNEAQFIEPRVEGNDVVFEYNEIHSSGGFFKNEKIYLTKSAGRWYFNGEMVKEVTEN